MNESARDTAFLDLELSVEVWLANERVPLARLLDLEPGGVLPLSHDPDGPVDLVVNGATVATGELVVIDGKFGFRVAAPSSENIAAAAAAATDGGAADEPVPVAAGSGDAADAADAAPVAAAEPAPDAEETP